jgi:hypothetical protein
MEGKIEDIDLYSLVELLTRRPGRVELRIRRRQEEAVLVFAGGELLEAQVGKLGGEEALFEVLGWKEGRFRVTEWKS